jgi:CHAD domain-containing protein
VTATPAPPPPATARDVAVDVADVAADVGLARHMVEARALHDRALTADLLDPAGVELVHDLRVAIRRCRSLAQGLAAVDLTGRAMWRDVSRAGRPLFQGLGALRDAQVMREWVEQLVTDAAARDALLVAIDAAIAARVDGARAAVADFDVVTWDSLAAQAPPRAHEMLRHRPALLWLAIVRWQEARALHVEAMRRRTPEALHRVRIGVKRLRYTLESLLPELHRAVQKPLKKLQELLGEIHDLDVAIAEATLLGVDSAIADLAAARAARLAAYKALATGRTSVWTTLRRALPDRPDALLRCRRGYLLEVAASVGVDGRRARAAERAAIDLARGLHGPLSPESRLAVLLAPARPRRAARRACRQLLGFTAEEAALVRNALRRDPLVRAAGVLTAPK